MEDEPVFAALTFFARKHPGELCGSNGLPLTPNSITIHGRSQWLKTLAHPHLCEYIDAIRGKHERIIVVSEYHLRSIKQLPSPITTEQIQQIAGEVLLGLTYLNKKDIVHRSLSPDNILLDSQDHVKLFNYGLYYMSNFSRCVSFPIGSPKYTAPEVLLNRNKSVSGPKTDVWSLGMILAEISLKKELWAGLKLSQVLRRVLSLLNCSGTVLEHLANEHNCAETLRTLPPQLRTLIDRCLQTDVRKRPCPAELLEGVGGWLKTGGVGEEENNNQKWFHVGFLKRGGEGDVCHSKWRKQDCLTKEATEQQLQSRAMLELTSNLKELYYLWQLAGGDVGQELRRQGMMKSKPSILTLASLVLLEGTSLGEPRDSASMLDLRVVRLPLDTLRRRVAQAAESMQQESGAETLPLVIRERDTGYQLKRILLFKRLLLGYPYEREKILKEAEKDVPPLVRGDVWAALLGVMGDLQGRYQAIDKETHTHTDRQIEVDIPRCHQYDELLSSSTGHVKLKRVLKAWVQSHPQYVYWQGLDSLCAPFLYLNFTNEPQSLACLAAFIPRYLHEFFLKDNSSVVQECLSKFRQLTAFHEPRLASHLDSIAFIPELFAIPWFLTVFSHVFPLHKIFHLWDKLLLGDSSFPLYVGLSVLLQLKDTLLCSGFNECILLFSDLPEIDMERCVADSTRLYRETPRSITYRQHTCHNECWGSGPLDMTPVPLSVLQAEFCPRLSAADLLFLLDVDRFSGEHPQLVVVDVRSVDEWSALSIQDSLHVPFNSISFSELQIPNTRQGRQLSESHGKTLCVVGSGGQNITEFCTWLVQCGLPRVCSLHGGIQVLKHTNILCSPQL